ncbi:MAG: UDP-glucose 4-epimerase GalE [Moraxellaceae bacterium]
MKVLVTGGAGYIGSHTCVELLAAGHDVLVIDNLCNSTPHALERVQQITGRTVPLEVMDVRDRAALTALFAREKFDAVVHFAGLKAVGESVADPLRYYDNNVAGSLVLLEVMQAAGCHRIVFSSSATVYGDPDEVPVPETAALRPANPYGMSKLMVEQMMRDLAASDARWQIALLRYFNPVGAHPSGLIGEAPNDIPNNLMPYVSQVAVGRRDKLNVFGGDYPTPDGTGVRDYLHVVDLAIGHVRALEWLAADAVGKVRAINLGTGVGCSVLEVVHAFEQAAGRALSYEIVARRPGDVPCYYADPTLAAELLGWRAERTLLDMCRDAWHWQSMNPDGYA